MYPAMMIDCTPLHSGGGVQVAIGLLDALCKTDQRWVAAIPSVMLEQLPASLACDPRLIIFPKRGLADFFRMRTQLVRLEKKFKPDVVFTVFGPAYFKAKAPHVVGFALPNLVYPKMPHWPRPGILAELSNRIKSRMLKQADQIVVETDTFRKRASEALGIKLSDIHVIGNAVNPVLEGYLATPLETGNQTHILIPSAWYPHKNLESVVTLAFHLQHEFPQINACFQFTLPPQSDGWLRLQQAANNVGVAEHIETLGALTLDQLATAYRTAQMVYLPTWREVSTAVYPEAFHFNRPLVTTDIDFAHELCGDAALFVNPDDAAETAASIASLLNSPSRQMALVRAGSKQLKRGYPTAQQKFRAQLDLMTQLARHRTT